MSSSIKDVRKTSPSSTIVGGTATRIKFYDKDGNVMINKRGWSLTRGLVEEFRDLHDFVNGNRVRLIDSMVYASDALAKAAWVPEDDAATTGITVTKDSTDYLNGTANVKFTAGSAFASAVSVTKTLSSDTTNFQEDIYAKSGYQNWKPYNYIIIPHHTKQAWAATDADVVLTDRNGVTAIYSLPEIDANHADKWGTHSIAFSAFTAGTGFDWGNVASIGFELNGATMGNNEYFTVGEIVLCKYSNGFTPAIGPLVPMELAADNVAEGMQLKLAGAGVLPRVGIGGDGDEEIVGIACGAGDTGDVILVQVGGPFVGELGALTSLEVGDYMAGAAAGGLTWTESAATGADAIAKYIAPFKDSAAQYTLAWMTLNTGGAVPS